MSVPVGINYIANVFNGKQDLPGWLRTRGQYYKKNEPEPTYEGLVEYMKAVIKKALTKHEWKFREEWNKYPELEDTEELFRSVWEFESVPRSHHKGDTKAELEARVADLETNLTLVQAERDFYRDKVTEMALRMADLVMGSPAGQAG